MPNACDDLTVWIGMRMIFACMALLRLDGCEVHDAMDGICCCSYLGTRY
jgi:hypothetical protein